MERYDRVLISFDSQSLTQAVKLNPVLVVSPFFSNERKEENMISKTLGGNF